MYTLYKFDVFGNRLMTVLLDSSKYEAQDLTEAVIKAENKIISISDEVLQNMYASGEIYGFVKQLIPDLYYFPSEKMRFRYDDNDNLIVQVSPLWYMDEINYAVFHHTDE